MEKEAGDTRRARSIVPPEEGGIARLFPGAHLVDAFAIALQADVTRDIDTLARAIFANPAPWFTGLLTVRDIAMAPLGIKTSSNFRKSANQRGVETISFFQVRSRTEREVILGEDDKHSTSEFPFYYGIGSVIREARWWLPQLSTATIC